MGENLLVNRKTIQVEVDSLLEGFPKDKLELFDHSLVTVKFNERVSPLDIGSWCYLKREPSGYRGQRIVQLSSILVKRKKAVSNALEHIVLELSTGKSEPSLLLELTIFERFLSWCDKNDESKVLNSPVDARNSIVSYISTLKSEIRSQSTSTLTAVSKQNYSLKWLALCLGIDQSLLIEGISLLKKNMSAVNSAITPLNTEAELQLKCYNQIFSQITDLLTNCRPLPHKLHMPQQDIWLMPQKRVFATPKMLKERSEWKWQYRALDYKNGKIYDPSEIEQFYNGKTSHNSANSAVINALKLQAKVNKNPRHFIRIFLFNYAQAAFYNLFLANTGMNSKQAFELDWNDDFKIDKDIQGIKVIKYRAKGRLQKFQISTTFLLTFKLFLKLREFILNGESFPKLFISHHNGKLNIQTLRRDYLTGLTRKHLGPLMDRVPISPREWRAYKATKILEQTKGDIQITADLLQNSTTTLKKSYGNISLEIATSEFNSFFERLKERSEIGVSSTPAGGCVDLGQPITKHSSVSPNCSIYEHCLFCEKYAFHADKEDVWKILSMKYVILETQCLASSIEHFNQLFSEVLGRIEHLIKLAVETNKMTMNEVNKIEKEVQEEELSPYWKNKLNLLVNIGAL
ncbi:hypothetical protein J3L11_05645 [Shewanella sp. 4t3-1-2LB]|uniref:hypothetical protein n=1 Tax=Shewanella sp. 4t3-1-2LB TaxID=2817682 RepID=UPI001A97E817|nr:hypothetical protein [Shewanella sp. 4t3-1-2LB]MBO1271133.1 hypothetical protein [Shewanella sp. 4t3-1-2LB]